ncbi:type I restriction enzyme S subunit [Sphaerotilus sulfidivorans]|uniref:Restriction endonuclease subunit S n=1 Tax=Sphaerotilus sulfidivorans TaxID=639200 RepID=A0A5C1Q243_9BURK|nr:restriction endonuclease subunit S [Sphaerotilus sulfidivorans]NZD46774.1 restriction endonuclease subunit S [Sphaerotilus sulfidivorans]QEN00926.1 restriction endonuclease subunit S [Sphaerotilus sulfidivorans]
MSLPKYPHYKPSGVQWLGDVPAHWEITSLSQICDLLQTGPFGSQLHSDDYVDAGIPVVNPSNIVGEKIVPDYSCSVSDADAQRLIQHRLQAGDVVVGRRGEMGRCAVVSALEAGWLCGTGSLLIRLKSHMRPDFLSVYMRTPYVRELLSLVSVGSTMANLSAGVLGGIRIPTPDYNEQTAIAHFLDHETAKIDALIAEQEKLIQLLAEKRQATLSHAVTRGLDPAAPMKDSGVAWLGEVPAHWEVRRIKSLIHSIEQGWSPQCENFPVSSVDEWGVLKVGCVNGGIFRADENKKLPPELQPVQHYALKKNDVLVSRANTRELVGSAAVVPEDFSNLMLCDKLYRLRLIENLCSADFIAAYLGTGVARSQIELGASGASSSMLNIGQSVILDLLMPLPSQQEQEKIIAFITEKTAALDGLYAEAERAIALLKERRAALIAAAVTGQIDVRQAVAA